MSTALDLFLALLVLGLAVRMLSVRDLFEGIALFIAFGLALALVWVRVGVPDIALAEVALGAGVTGALLVNTYARLRSKAPEWVELRPSSRAAGSASRGGRSAAAASRVGRVAAAASRGGHAAAATLCGLVAGAAGLAIVRLPRAGQPLGPVIDEHVAATAVSNPVTAVLLDFRAYDTLLEVAVLLGGLVAVWALERGRPAVPPPTAADEEPVLAELVRWIVPLIVITALYLTWLGSHAPGGAFQAGALLAGAGVLLLAGGFLLPRGRESAVLRAAAASGLFVFTAVALHALVTQGTMLRYAEPAYYWILGIEMVLTLSIAVILADFFVDVPAAPGDQP